MRQIVTTANGDIDVLKVQEKPDPTPRDDEIVFILTMSTGARVHDRAGGLRASEIKGEDGLR